MFQGKKKNKQVFEWESDNMAPRQKNSENQGLFEHEN